MAKELLCSFDAAHRKKWIKTTAEIDYKHSRTLLRKQRASNLTTLNVYEGAPSESGR